MISEELKKHILEFRKRRDWEKFHTPKDLAVSIVIEASELLERFQWKTDREIIELLKSEFKHSVSDEIADIAIYLSYLCHDLGINLDEAVARKLKKNNEKYPAEKVRGRAKKYNDL